MKKIIDLPDFIFISLLFIGLFLLTVGNVELIVVMMILMFVLLCVSIMFYIDQKKRLNKRR